MTRIHSYDYTRKRNMKRGRIRCFLLGMIVMGCVSSMTYYINNNAHLQDDEQNYFYDPLPVIAYEDLKVLFDNANESDRQKLCKIFVTQVTKSNTPPLPVRKPVWIQENAEFQAQLEAAIEGIVQ